MVFPWRSGHRFRASPLSLAVPLEGTETVVGLRELQRRKDGQDLAKALNLDALTGSKRKGQWRKRYRGPYWHQLELSHLKADAKSWRSFFLGQGWHTYNIPESLDHFCERSEENFVIYLPNYLRLLLGLIIIAFCARPWSFIGAAAVAGVLLLKLTAAAREEIRALPLRRRFWALLERGYAEAHAAMLVHQTDGQQQQQPQVTAAPPVQQGGHETLGMLQSVLQVLCYVLLVYCNTLGQLARGVFWWVWLAAAHACLRRSPSECLETLRRPDVAALPEPPGSGHPAVPGVALVQVLGLTRDGCDDPRRVFREAWHLLSSIGAAAGAYSWHGLQFYCHKALLHARSYLPHIQGRAISVSNYGTALHV